MVYNPSVAAACHDCGFDLHPCLPRNSQDKTGSVRIDAPNSPIPRQDSTMFDQFGLDFCNSSENQFCWAETAVPNVRSSKTPCSMDSRRIQQVFQSRCVLQRSMQPDYPLQLMPAKFEANAANTKRRCCLDLFWSVWSACNICFFPGLLCLDGCFAAAMSSCLLCPFCFSAFITQLQRRLYDLTTSSLGPPRAAAFRPWSGQTGKHAEFQQH